MAEGEETEGLNRNLSCILFPGLVKNDDKAIQCLGGIKEISQLHTSNYKRRLKLNFQPDNPFVKPIYSDYSKCAGVLHKIRVKKTKAADGSVKRELLSTEIVGRVTNITTFESLSDFQYLPVESTPKGEVKCIIDNVIPSEVGDVSDLEKPASLYIVPKYFSLQEKPFGYMYTCKKAMRSHATLKGDINPAAQNFNLFDELPTKLQDDVARKLTARIALFPAFKEAADAIQKLFEERPIWSANQLLYRTRMRRMTLRRLLPLYALFYTAVGPWRLLWVRYGYDPRKCPEARYYQTLDFRLRTGIKNTNTLAQIAPRFRALLKMNHVSTQAEELNITEAHVFFRPGMLPLQRQSYYQICDVELPEVQAMLSVEPSAGMLCHATRGWWPPGLAEAARTHMTEYATRAAMTQNICLLKSEQPSSEDEQSSENEEEDSTSFSDPNEPSTSKRRH